MDAKRKPAKLLPVSGRYTGVTLNSRLRRAGIDRAATVNAAAKDQGRYSPALTFTKTGVVFPSSKMGIRNSSGSMGGTGSGASNRMLPAVVFRAEK